MKIAVLSDIHSAAAPFEAALAAARGQGFDQLVILGDLLTYGPQPERCLALASEALARDNAVLILGNHDSLYLAGGSYGRPLPEWIQESVEWTRERIGAGALDPFPWTEEWTAGSTLLSHANPFGSGDWSYLRSGEDHERAASCLAERGFSAGIFGHVHRIAEHHGAAAVFTVGSLGQPRNRDDKRPSWASVELDSGEPVVTHHLLEIDWQEHCRALHATNMTSSTIEQLCRFYL